MLWTLAMTKPPPGLSSSIRRTVSSWTSPGVPRASVFWGSTVPPQKVMASPNSAYRPAVSMPSALTWTGLSASTPMSMRSPMSSLRAPQE